MLFWDMHSEGIKGVEILTFKGMILGQSSWGEERVIRRYDITVELVVTQYLYDRKAFFSWFREPIDHQKDPDPSCDRVYFRE